MADPYQKCTCGCGRNLKHCASKAVIAELDAIDQAIAGNQRIAAVHRIDNLLAAEPDSTLLLSIKARVQLELSDMEGAKETIAAFEKLAPESPTMKVLRALVVAEEDPDAALHSLLSAWEQREHADPQTLAFSVLIVSQALIMSGNPAAARRLLETLPDNQEVVQRVRTQAAEREQEESVFIRIARSFDSAPSDHPLKEKLDAIDRAIARLEWLKADQLLQEVAPQNPQDPHIMRRIGALLLLRQQEDAWVAWKHLAKMEGEAPGERLFAEIVRILEMPASDEWMTDLLEVTWPVDSLETVLEKLASDQRFYASPQPPQPTDGPPPRGQYFVLSKPLPEDKDNPAIDDVPEMLGELTLYGKQTDAPARLVLRCLEQNLESAETVLRDLVDSPTPSDRQTIGATFQPDVATSLGLFLPPEFSDETRERLVAEAQRISILEKWPATPHPALDGMTPLEAAKDDSKRQAVNAMIVILETGSEGSLDHVRELRKQMGFPYETIPADSLNCDEMLPVDGLTRLPLTELSDSDLIKAIQQLMVFGPRLLAEAVEIALRRPSLLQQEEFKLHTVCEYIAKQSASRAEAVDWLWKAAEIAEASGDSPAEYLLALLVPAAMIQREELLNEAMSRLTSKHLDEPGVREGLMSFFQMIGIDPATGQPIGGGPGGPSPAVGEPQAAPAGGQAEGGLWTPDGGGQAGGDKGEGGGLWLPD